MIAHRSDSLGTFQRALRLPLRLIPPAATVRILMGPLRGHKWIVGSSTHGCWIGTFERHKQEVFAATILQGDVVYDLGAHVGLYSLLAASRGGFAGHVYAFEPVPRNLAYLYRHLSLNGVTNCSVIDAAVTSTSGMATFDQSVHPAMGHLGAGGSDMINARTVVLDELLQAARFALQTSSSATSRAPSIVLCAVPPRFCRSTDR